MFFYDLDNGVFCYLCNKVLDIDNLVSVLYLFLYSILKILGNKKISFLFFLYKLIFSSANHYCLRELHITCEKKID